MGELTAFDIAQDSAWIDTPAIIVDSSRLERNIVRFQELANHNGVGLRPHIKTHKSIEIAQMQLAAGATGVTAAKLSEARHFFSAGIVDVFVAYTIVGPIKSRLAAELALRGSLIVGTDNAVSIQDLSDACRTRGSILRVRIEVDTGLARGGVTDVDTAYDLARAIDAAPNLEFDGIYTFRSSTFPSSDGRDRHELGHAEGDIISRFAEALRAKGVTVTSVSAGSTPTGVAAAEGIAVTEIRAGTYVFNDYLMAHLGVASYDDIALAVLATVVSRPGPGIAIVDAGSKALSSDFYPGRLGLEAYGVAADGRQIDVTRLSEEHGVCRLGPDVDLAVGERVALIPSHSCTTVNLADEFLMISASGESTRVDVIARGATH